VVRASRVYSLRHSHGIAPNREGERAERGEATIEEAAAALSVSPSTILRMLRDGALPGQQLCKGAPWIIRSQIWSVEGGGEMKQSVGTRGVRRLAIPARKALILKEMISMGSKSPSCSIH
jgi:excisionase family DNA binding protein